MLKHLYCRYEITPSSLVLVREQILVIPRIPFFPPAGLRAKQIERFLRGIVVSGLIDDRKNFYLNSKVHLDTHTGWRIPDFSSIACIPHQWCGNGVEYLMNVPSWRRTWSLVRR